MLTENNQLLHTPLIEEYSPTQKSKILKEIGEQLDAYMLEEENNLDELIEQYIPLLAEGEDIESLLYKVSARKLSKYTSELLIKIWSQDSYIKYSVDSSILEITPSSELERILLIFLNTGVHRDRLGLIILKALASGSLENPTDNLIEVAFSSSDPSALEYLEILKSGYPDRVVDAVKVLVKNSKLNDIIDQINLSIKHESKLSPIIVQLVLDNIKLLTTITTSELIRLLSLRVEYSDELLSFMTSEAFVLHVSTISGFIPKLLDEFSNQDEGYLLVSKLIEVAKEKLDIESTVGLIVNTFGFLNRVPNKARLHKVFQPALEELNKQEIVLREYDTELILLGMNSNYDVRISKAIFPILNITPRVYLKILSEEKEFRLPAPNRLKLELTDDLQLNIKTKELASKILEMAIEEGTFARISRLVDKKSLVELWSKTYYSQAFSLLAKATELWDLIDQDVKDLILSTNLPDKLKESEIDELSGITNSEIFYRIFCMNHLLKKTHLEFLTQISYVRDEKKHLITGKFFEKEISQILQDKFFANAFPEHREAASLANSIGEKALWVRAAFGNIDPARIHDLILRIHKEYGEGLEGITTVTRLHLLGIFLEKYLDSPVVDLFQREGIARLAPKVMQTPNFRYLVETTSIPVVERWGLISRFPKIIEDLEESYEDENIEETKIFACLELIGSAISENRMELIPDIQELFGYAKEILEIQFILQFNKFRSDIRSSLVKYFNINDDKLFESVTKLLEYTRSEEGSYSQYTLSVLTNFTENFENLLELPGFIETIKKELKIVLENPNGVISLRLYRILLEIGVIGAKESRILFIRSFTREQDFGVWNMEPELLSEYLDLQPQDSIPEIISEVMVHYLTNEYSNSDRLSLLIEIIAKTNNDTAIKLLYKLIRDFISDHQNMISALHINMRFGLKINLIQKMKGFVKAGKANSSTLVQYLKYQLEVIPDSEQVDILKSLLNYYIKNQNNNDVHLFSFLLEQTQTGHAQMLGILSNSFENLNSGELEVLMNKVMEKLDNESEEEIVKIDSLLLKVANIAQQEILSKELKFSKLDILLRLIRRVDRKLEVPKYYAGIKANVEAVMPELSYLSYELPIQTESENPLILYPSIEHETAEEDSWGFYKNNVLFWESKKLLDPDAIREILGNDLFEELQELKADVIKRMLDDGFNLYEHTKQIGTQRYLVHGTGQANAKDRLYTDSEAGNPQATVGAICNSSGIGIRGEKASVGPFLHFANTGYGSPEDGSVVLMFADDLINAHTSIAKDPAGFDGLVTMDKKTGRLIAVTNRVCLNPQAATVEGNDLTNLEMTNFLLYFQAELDQNSEFVSRIRKRTLEYESRPENLLMMDYVHRIQSLVEIEGYSACNGLWYRDRYSILKHSRDPLDNQLAKMYELIIDAQPQPEGIKVTLDALEKVWQEDPDGLQKLFTFGTLAPTYEQMITAIEKLFIDIQQHQFLQALNDLKDDHNGKLGVLRQLDIQRQFASKSRKWRFEKLLELNRVIFTSRASKNPEVLFRIIQNLSEYITTMKVGVLRESYIEALKDLNPKSKGVLRRYSKYYSFCSSGSLARGEAVLSSDIDYLIILDDKELREDQVDELREALSELGFLISQNLEQYFVRPDAGLANLSRQPITKFSELEELSIRRNSRQTVEPSEIFDLVPIDRKRGSKKLVSKIQAILGKRVREEDELSGDLRKYFLNDWETYHKHYLAGLSQLLNADVVIDTKMQFSRAIQFFINTLWAEHLGTIDFTKSTATSIEKLNMLTKIVALSREQSHTLKHTLTMIYRFRYRGDLFSSAYAEKAGLDNDKVRKIKARMDPNYLPPLERSKFIDLITETLEIMENHLAPIQNPLDNNNVPTPHIS